MIQWSPKQVVYEFRVPYVSQGGTLRPVAPVRLRSGSSACDILAILDTGANFSTFPSQVARVLGVDLRRQPLDVSRGTAGPVRTWRARLELTQLPQSHI